MTKSATQRLADLRDRQAALAAEEKALLDARLTEIATIVDRCGGAALPDEIIAGTIRYAVDGDAETRARIADIGGTFLRPSRRKSASDPRPSSGPKGPPPVAKSDMAAAASDAAIAGENGAQISESGVQNG